MTGTYQLNIRKKWEDFRKEYSDKIIPGLAPRSRPEVETALNNFQRIIKPVLVATLNTGRVDDFVAMRRQEEGKKPGTPISPATVNKDLRHVKAALHVAVEWGYLPRLPRFMIGGLSMTSSTGFGSRRESGGW